MARQARRISKSGNYYIVLKGEELFVTSGDKEKFLEILNERFEGGSVYGAEITKTEIHLAVKESGKGISMIMKSVTTAYARYFNRANGREGKLFEGRFKSEPLETEAELDECVKNLKSGTVSAPKKRTAPKTKEEPKPAAKKNLPSWLL